MKPFAIIDVDNCLSDDGWRIPLIDHSHPVVAQRYVRYHDHCSFDLPGFDNLEVVKELGCSHRLAVFTARPEAVRSKTERWLSKWGIEHAHLFMREDSNHESSVLLKRRMFYRLREYTLFDIATAVDDREDILAMYRELGVPNVIRLAIHDLKE